MNNRKQIDILKEDNYEIDLIAAEVNAQSKTAFLEDLFLHFVNSYRLEGKIIPEIEISSGKPDELSRLHVTMSEETSYWIRVIAVRHYNLRMKLFMQSFIRWLAVEHRKSGRVWFDDTSVKVLPIRNRK